MGRIARASGVLALAVGGHLAGVGLPAAAAHDGEGVLVVESQGPPAGLAVPYVIRLTWANDGHAAVDATITATPIAPDGTPQTPVPMQPVDQDGRYTATVTYPSAGRWTVRFTSVTPTATTETIEAVVAPTTTTTAPTTTTTTESPATTEPTSQAADPDDDETGIGGLLAAALLVIVVIGAVVGFVRAARRTKAET